RHRPTLRSVRTRTPTMPVVTGAPGPRSTSSACPERGSTEPVEVRRDGFLRTSHLFPWTRISKLELSRILNFSTPFAQKTRPPEPRRWAAGRPRPRRALALVVTLSLVSMFTSYGLTADRLPWEMRVCADPAALPFSNAAEEGFENRIASLLADELGATLTYDWSVFTEDLVNLRFAEGECDVIMGVPDGFERATTTIAYYQSPYGT